MSRLFYENASTRSSPLSLMLKNILWIGKHTTRPTMKDKLASQLYQAARQRYEHGDEPPPSRKKSVVPKKSEPTKKHHDIESPLEQAGNVANRKPPTKKQIPMLVSDAVSGPIDVDTGYPVSSDVVDLDKDVDSWKPSFATSIPKTRSSETKATVASYDEMEEGGLALSTDFAVRHVRSNDSTIATHEDVRADTTTQCAVRPTKSDDASTIVILPKDAKVATKPSSTDNHKDKEQDQEKPLGSGWSKLNYNFAGLLCLFYVCLIAGLVYGLYAIREAAKERNALTEVPTGNPTILSFDDFSLKPTAQDSAQLSISLVPTTDGPTEEPSISPTKPPTKSPTKHPTRTPTLTPSENPTISPTPYPTTSPTYIFFAEEMHFKEIMDNIDPNIWFKTMIINSPQRKALKWLVGDPNYFNYKNRRLVQRYVLAVTKLTITRTPTEAFDLSWMEYTDECTWFTSWYENILSCDADKHFRYLVLRNLGLDGIIPNELTLLTRLRYLILTANQLEGTIPEGIGAMTALSKLHLNGNLLTGTIPSGINQLTRLDDLVIDGNLLTGMMPYEVCGLDMTVRQADCHLLWCNCCTNCISNFPAPLSLTASPTSFPTTNPVQTLNQTDTEAVAGHHEPPTRP